MEASLSMNIRPLAGTIVPGTSGLPLEDLHHQVKVNILQFGMTFLRIQKPAISIPHILKRFLTVLFRHRNAWTVFIQT
jgi:hypothetical protein